METRILVLGIGNSGRSDDALGWKFIDLIKDQVPFEVDYRYQLQVEDADVIRKFDKVVFVDATRENLPDGFSFKECQPRNSMSFSTHRLDPESALWLCQELYGPRPEGYVLAIAGTNWELSQGLSPVAEENIKKAISFFKTWTFHTLSASAPLR